MVQKYAICYMNVQHMYEMKICMNNTLMYESFFLALHCDGM